MKTLNNTKINNTNTKVSSNTNTLYLNNTNQWMSHIEKINSRLIDLVCLLFSSKYYHTANKQISPVFLNSESKFYSESSKLSIFREILTIFTKNIVIEIIKINFNKFQIGNEAKMQQLSDEFEMAINALLFDVENKLINSVEVIKPSMINIQEKNNLKKHHDKNVDESNKLQVDKHIAKSTSNPNSYTICSEDNAYSFNNNTNTIISISEVGQLNNNNTQKSLKKGNLSNNFYSKKSDTMKNLITLSKTQNKKIKNNILSLKGNNYSRNFIPNNKSLFTVNTLNTITSLNTSNFQTNNTNNTLFTGARTTKSGNKLNLETKMRIKKFIQTKNGAINFNKESLNIEKQNQKNQSITKNQVNPNKIINSISENRNDSNTIKPSKNNLKKKINQNDLNLKNYQSNKQYMMNLDKDMKINNQHYTHLVGEDNKKRGRKQCSLSPINQIRSCKTPTCNPITNNLVNKINTEIVKLINSHSKEKNNVIFNQVTNSKDKKINHNNEFQGQFHTININNYNHYNNITLVKSSKIEEAKNTKQTKKLDIKHFYREILSPSFIERYNKIPNYKFNIKKVNNSLKMNLNAENKVRKCRSSSNKKSSTLEFISSSSKKKDKKHDITYDNQNEVQTNPSFRNLNQKFNIRIENNADKVSQLFLI